MPLGSMCLASQACRYPLHVRRLTHRGSESSVLLYSPLLKSGRHSKEFHVKGCFRRPSGPQVHKGKEARASVLRDTLTPSSEGRRGERVAANFCAVMEGRTRRKAATSSLSFNPSLCHGC